MLLQATLMDTQELRWWLSGFGSKVEIVEPVELRDYFAAEAQAMLEAYSG